MTVTVEGLTKRFGKNQETAAADRVSFEAPRGRVTSLLGPSGSGKSTVLRLIAGLEQPDAGLVRIEGQDCTHITARKREVGFVFQSYALFGHMTVGENIGFGLRIRGASKATIRDRVRELLALVQLESYEARYPRQLSGGQRQRVSLARALATSPKVLLLDEPFGALDAQVRVELREWLLGFQEKTQVTTIMVTHDQEEALELSSHIVLLRDGQVVQAGTPHELYDSPAAPFVASFLGGSNVLRGRVNAGRLDVGGVRIDAPNGTVDGATAEAYVRPQDVRIAPAPDGTASIRVAKVERLIRIGAHVKLSLLTASGDAITVQLPKQEVDDLGIDAGDRVMLDVTEAKVFVEDYAI
jgi:sulfate transport system ATP-binding protein